MTISDEWNAERNQLQSSIRVLKDERDTWREECARLQAIIDSNGRGVAETCKGCGQPIEWAEIGGGRIPLDLVSPIYVRPMAGEMKGKWRRAAPGVCGVDHAATCPWHYDDSMKKAKQ